MTDIGMTESIGESGLKLEIWFRRRKTNDKAYTLHARSHSVKQAWTQDISKLLWKQAFRSKGELLSPSGPSFIKLLKRWGSLVVHILGSYIALYLLLKVYSNDPTIRIVYTVLNCILL